MTSAEIVVEGDLNKLPAAKHVEADLEYPERAVYEVDEYDIFPWCAVLHQENNSLVLHEKHIDNMVLRVIDDD